MIGVVVVVVLFFKQKTAYEMRISDWSSDVCSSDLLLQRRSKQHSGIETGGKAVVQDFAWCANPLAAALEACRRFTIGNAALRRGRPDCRGDLPDPLARQIGRAHV